MSPTKNETPVIRYSPRPISDYTKTHAGVELGPGTSVMLKPAQAWNLAYLSYDYDKSIQHPDPEFTVLVRRTCQTKLDGTGLDVVGNSGVPLVESLLELPAARFVHLITQHPALKTLPMFTAYGQPWLDTITARSYKCQTDESPPDNVVDFSAARALLAKF